MNANQYPFEGFTASLSSDLTPHLFATGGSGSAAASVPSAIGRIAHGSRDASGEGAVVEFLIQTETDADVPAREALLDRAMGASRRRKSSEKLRRGRLPAEGLAFVARDASGAVVGTVRLWDVRLGDAGRRALLLGPLAVDPAIKSAGIGSALMRHAITEAQQIQHDNGLVFRGIRQDFLQLFGGGINGVHPYPLLLLFPGPTIAQARGERAHVGHLLGLLRAALQPPTPAQKPENEEIGREKDHHRQDRDWRGGAE